MEKASNKQSVSKMTIIDENILELRETNTMQNDIARIESAETLDIAAGNMAEKSFAVYPYWEGKLQLQLFLAINKVNFNITLRWLDRHKSVVHVESADITSDHEGTLNLPFVTDSPYCHIRIYPDQQILTEPRLEVKFHPPLLAASCFVRLENKSNEAPIQISIQNEPCVLLNKNKLTRDAINDVEQLKLISPYSVSEILLELLRKFPSDQEILRVSLDAFDQLNDNDHVILTANRILRNIKEPDLCILARKALSKLLILEPNWYPEPLLKVENEIFASDQFPDRPKIAKLVDGLRSPEEIRIIGADLGSFIVTPLGHKRKRNATGRSYEIERLGAVNCFHLNCIAASDVLEIPVEVRIEFTALLLFKIFVREKPNLIVTKFNQEDISTILVAHALSKRFQIPNILELLESPNSSSGNTGEDRNILKDTSFEKVRKCMRDTDAIITNSDTRKKELVRIGIDLAKIFVRPAPTKEVWRPTELDSQKTNDLYREAYRFAMAKYC